MSDYEDDNLAESMATVLAFAREQQDLAKQHDEASKMEIEAFIDSLSPEQLKTLNKMIVLCVGDTDIGWQLTGAISGALIWKHGRSWNGDESPLSDPATSIAYKLNLASGEPSTELDRINRKAKDEYADNLKLYGLVPDPATDGHFKCNNCGQWYISLEDRMLKPPGPSGCSGCQQKAMFG